MNIITNKKTIMKKGDILKGKKTKHPIIFLKEKNKDQFVGCIITHSTDKEYSNNIGLKPVHFCSADEKGKAYLVIFDNSFFVDFQVLKEASWGPYTVTGKLTEEGVTFIENYLQKSHAVKWKDYMKTR